jgi:anti-sigma factor RsiW
MSRLSVRGTCRESVGVMGELMEGALSADDVVAVEGHLADCPRCRELLASLRALPSVIRDLARAEEPAGLQARILAALALKS